MIDLMLSGFAGFIEWLLWFAFKVLWLAVNLVVAIVLVSLFISFVSAIL